MVITAVENTSMLGLTLSDIFVDDDTLYIDFDKYRDDEKYNEDETCISIIIPILYASYERTIYEVVLVRTDDIVQMERAYFYVDAYTGKVIGGMEKGD